jgi:ribosomal protein S18 acetylase RimI-like enzyme
LTFTVRRFHDADLSAIKELDRQSFPPDDQYSDELYERFTSDDNHRTFVTISKSGGLAGYALLDLSGDPVRLRNLAVHPNHRNAGCGSALLRAILLETPRSIDLFVELENAAAIRLYERFGFTFADNTGEMPSRRRMPRCADRVQSNRSLPPRRAAAVNRAGVPGSTDRTLVHGR